MAPMDSTSWFLFGLQMGIVVALLIYCLIDWFEKKHKKARKLKKQLKLNEINHGDTNR